MKLVSSPMIGWSALFISPYNYSSSGSDKRFAKDRRVLRASSRAGNLPFPLRIHRRGKRDVGKIVTATPTPRHRSRKAVCGISNCLKPCGGGDLVASHSPPGLGSGRCLASRSHGFSIRAREKAWYTAYKPVVLRCRNSCNTNQIAGLLHVT